MCRAVGHGGRTRAGCRDQIAGGGGSAGGHLAASAALVDGFDAKGEDAAISARPNALVLFNPALHIDEFAAKRETGVDQQLAAAITPNRFIRAGGPPAIIFFGTDDRLITGAQQYLAKARPLGLRAELWTAAGQPHGFFNRSPWTEATARRVDLFLESLGYLSGPPTCPATWWRCSVAMAWSATAPQSRRGATARRERDPAPRVTAATSIRAANTGSPTSTTNSSATSLPNPRAVNGSTKMARRHLTAR